MACGAVSLGTLGGCESTQDQSARLAKNARKLANVKGLTVTTLNPTVKVVQTSVLHDANGTAAVVTVKSSAKQAQAALPISITVSDASGKALFQNNAPGLEASLVQIPLLAAGQTFTWVDDQVTGAGAPSRVTARIGPSPAAESGSVPRISIQSVSLMNDPVNGVEAVGTIANMSKIPQPRLVIFCVARRAGRVVAAGRAIVPTLNPAPTPKPVRFTLFFIGDPRGAGLELSAPPTALK